MNKKDLLFLINSLNDEDDVDSILINTDLYKSGVSLDTFKNKVATEKEFINWFNSEKDKHLEKGLNTWKNNNLNNLVEAEILKRNPQKTPQELEMERLKAEIEAIKKEKRFAELNSKFKDIFVEKNIPTKMSSFLLNSEDEETINANITIFEDSMKTYIESEVNKRLSGNGIPSSGTEAPKTMTKEQFNCLSYSEKVKLYQENQGLFEELSK